MNDRPLRAMWLLAHNTARKFEIPMLKRIGIGEIFLPKVIPSHLEFRSTSVDWSEDSNLSIPAEELATLNAINWYDEPSADAWQLASRHFDVVFFIAQNGEFFKSICRHFTGAKIWRAYGLASPTTYHDILRILSGNGRPIWSPRVAKNFWVGHAYEHLANVEPPYLAEKSIFLPAGLADTRINDEWTGSNKKIFFVCPNLAASAYYRKVHRDFKRTFGDLPHVIAGVQAIKPHDEFALGYVSTEQHEQNLREFAAMYYHSTEPNHIHYHPFEAVRTGMPLVFIAGGLLDKFGGIDLPGRCSSPEEARTKLKLILEGDHRLIDKIRKSQERLLNYMSFPVCEPSWRAGFQTILQKLAESRTATSPRKTGARVAVIVPVGYRGGSLRGAKLLASAIEIGSHQYGSPAEVVFGHLDDPSCYSDQEFADIPRSIERRPYKWRVMSKEEARRACAYSGVEGELTSPSYIVPDDGMKQFMDCDLWVIVSDRLTRPLLPIRPHLLMVYDYLQRYVPFLDDATNQEFISRAHAADAVLVTTEFTANDARQFAGVPGKRVRKVPLLAPEFTSQPGPLDDRTRQKYFIWTTNLARHKNHESALKALRFYYEDFAGSFECHITGVDTKDLFKRELPHLIPAQEIRRSSRAVKANVCVEGELPEPAYQRMLQKAAFLWHPATVDNGTFSVVEAASFGVPSLSSDYPAMREIDCQFELRLTWSDPADPKDMAKKLKQMETTQGRKPSTDVFKRQSVEQRAREYWNVIREYL